jgi:acetylornithine deacetylase/succinyl-diaminopimelate desuccinylase-like protein
MAARIALYGSLLLVGGIAWALVTFLNQPLRSGVADRWSRVDYPSLPEVQLLRDYVRIDTSEATGDEIAGARFLAARLEKAGIHTEIEVVGERKANLYALLEGEDRHPLVLHNHIDVEKVDPAEWFHPPFEGFIEAPWIYGRGVFDMKSVAVAQLLALVDLKEGLKESGRPLKRSVLFLATSSEERGSRLGVRRILREHPEMVKDFWAVLTEGGVVEARARDDIKFWGTEVAQKRYVDLVVCSETREPLDQLRDTLKETGFTETDLRVIPEVREVLKVYGPTRDRQDLRDLLANPDATIASQPSFHKLPDYLRSMFRNEAVPFKPEEAKGGGWQLLIKIHLLPGANLETELPKLVPAWMLHGLSWTIDAPPAVDHGSPVDHPVFRQIATVLKERYPEAPNGPYFLPWTATDSRFFRAAGIPSYGFTPFLIMNTDTLQVDKANERFALPGFVEGVEVYRDVVRRLVLN